jgi:ABC-type transport system involved in multi-copper enzyme maturation permease subunit
VSFLVGPLSLGTGDRITLDMGLASLLLAPALILFTGGVHLVTREIDRKAVHVLLARPIGRTSYVLGKFLGMVLVGWIAVLLAFVLLTMALALRGDVPGWAVVQAGVLCLGEVLVLSAVVVLFSTVAGTVPATLYSVGTFVAGHALSEILTISAEDSTPAAQLLLDLFRWVVPDLSRFDMRLHAVHGVTVPAADLVVCWAYAVVYAGALLLIASAAFGRRELK